MTAPDPTAASCRQLLELFANGDIDVDRLRALLVEAQRTDPNAAALQGASLRAAVADGLIRSEIYLQLQSQLSGTADMPTSQPSSPARDPVSATILRRPRDGDRSTAGGETVLRSPEYPAGRAPPGVTPGPATPARTAAPARTDADLDDPHAWTGVWGEDVRVGDTLNERYRLERLLGRGGMGDVYLAHDEVEDQRFAIKLLNQDFRQHPEALRALREEVRKSRDLAHPNIVSVYMLNRDGTHAYMVMEFLEGKPLDRLLAEDFARGMPFQQALPIIRSIGGALAYAHDRGVIHSDLKPSNIFVMAGGKAKVLDFGIARAVRRQRNGRFDAGELGALTPAYASPEMISASDPPDVRDDIFGFACVVYELVTGRHPFGGQDAQTVLSARGNDVVPDISPALTKKQHLALTRALAFSRSKRTPSIETFIAELEGGSSSQGSRGWRRAALYAAGVVLLAVLVGVVGLVALKPSETEAFRDGLVRTLPPPTEDPDPGEVATLVELGHYYLEEAGKRFDSSLLSRGVSNAHGSFRKALELDPSKPEALDGVVRVFELYLDRATAMADEGQWPAAREAAQYGLEVNPDSARLKAILADAEAHLAEGR